MKNGLYHREIGLPPGAANLWAGVLSLEYSQHAQRAAREDRYGRLELYPEIEFEPSDVVEIELQEGEAVKAVLRIPLEDGRDMVFAILRPEAGRARVKTVWCNLGSDAHKTLDRSKYNPRP